LTGPARALVAASLALTQIVAQAQSDPPLLTAERAPEVAYIVRGIVQYTRWSPLPVPIRLCVSDAMDPATETAFARAVAEAKDGAAAIALSNRRLVPGSAIDAADCQVVLVNSTAPTQWRGLLLSLLDRPVLTIGFEEEFCSLGGMFCLDNSSGRLLIRANLDSIARSGMRINPQLLRLTQQRSAAR
jgi:hypothetical protein